jgi:uncharacterized protein (TIGR02391 family)
MNLETRVSPALWSAIRAPYESRNFTGAILDGIYVLTEVLREKSDSEADGAALVGHALGGSTPKVKITPLRSESDWNEQKGLEQILRGIYQGIRNPRSHGKRGDSQEDADAILLFLDSILKKLGEAQTLFSKPAFLDRVFDPHFLQTDHYASLLVEEIPVKYLLEVFYDVYRRRDEAKGNALHYFFQALLRRFPEEEQGEIWATVSADLRTASDFASIRSVVQMLKPEQWSKVAEVARLRIENRFIEDMKTGVYDARAKKCRSGALATWATGFLPQFTLKKEASSALMESLASDNREQQDYVFQFFFHALVSLVGKENLRLRRIMIGGLKAGDVRFHSRVTDFLEEEADKAWGPEVIAAFNAFEEQSVESSADTDDDLPF